MNPKNKVRRIYAVKKPGFDIEAAGLLHDLRDNLDLPGLQSVRIYNRYDCSGLTDEQYDQARTRVFSEPPVDDIFDEQTDFGAPDEVFAVEALPGQYDQRADSAAQCIQILTCEERPLVKTARVYALTGDLGDTAVDKIKDWLINPVENREAGMTKPDSLEDVLDEPQDIQLADGLIQMDDPALAALLKTAGFAMSLADLQFIRDWFRQEGRDPSWTELRVLDTYWSDHCRHTTFLTRIDNVEIDDQSLVGRTIRKSWQTYLDHRRMIHGDRLDSKPACLMDIATLAMKALRQQGKLDDLDVSEEINACSIKVTIPVNGQTQDYLVMFKNETHNHPTEIEPFGGAATCLGGAIRDPLSGRSYVYQAMRVTGSGDPTVPISETLPGKLSQYKITTTAAAGYSSYGNQIGLATGQVEEIYHPGYIAKRMEIGAVIGAAPASQVKREVPQPGDLVILLGGRTGRDGCGGATGSSKAHDEQSIIQCGSEVQKGNPPTERKIQRMFRDREVALMIKRCNDFGAGGVSVAIGELADGLLIDLDKVPKKYEGLDGTELAISESQERMAVVIDAKDADRFIAKAAGENLEAVPVATVTADPRLVMTWRGKVIVDLARSFIDSNGAPQQTSIRLTAAGDGDAWSTMEYSSKAEFSDNLKKGLSSLQSCSRKGLVERFDATIGAGTILMPFGGKCQLTPEDGMACLIPTAPGTTDTTDATSLMTFGYDPDLSSWSPYHGAYYAVAQSLAKIAALGGDASKARLTFQEYFERLTSEEKWGKPLAALLGAYQAQIDFGTPAIGGKDSMSGSFNDLNVPPTLVSFAVAVTRAGQVVSASLDKPGLSVYLLPVPQGEAGLPDPKPFMANLELVHRLASDKKVAAASTIKQAGAAVQIAQMCFGNQLGFEFDPGAQAILFQPRIADLLLAPTDTDAAEQLIRAGATLLGQTSEQPNFKSGHSVLALPAALASWRSKLEPVFPSQADPDLKMPSVAKPSKVPAAAHRVGPRIARPRVFIPVFPGTNCEWDTARAFARAGADPDILVVRNLTPSDIRQTMDEMVKRIGKSQIIMLPGGFSGGDEPEGSGKFITAAFRNPAVAEATRQLLGQRDGLMLGICNGFQALIKLGLLPYGDIRDLDAQSPTLTFNRIGRHVSCYVTTQVTSNRSPWMMQTQTGDLHQIPVSHGEGRFVANDAWLAQLIQNDQIATRYVDLTGQPTYDTAFNPNASVAAIEGITSPDGRILGKMGHSERQASGLAKNIHGDKDQRIFEAGVAYFS